MNYEIKEISSEDYKFIRNYDENDISVKIIEEQKVYYWIRVYSNIEIDNIKEGDIIIMEYLPNNERINLKFISYGKEGLNKNYESEIIKADLKDCKKILCLLVDENEINNRGDIPFLRTLFRFSRYFEYQVIKRSDLIFKLENGEKIDYYDLDL